METAAAVTPRRARRPLAALGKLTVASLVGGALLVGSDLFYHGMEALVPVLVLSTVVLVPAAIIAIGWRWAPLLAALVYAPSVVLAYLDTGQFLPRPHETYMFSFGVLFLALAIVGTGAGIGATVQNYRGDERRAPRWLAAALALADGRLCVEVRDDGAGLAAYCTSSALGAALTADIVAPAAMGGAIAQHTAAGSVAGVLSFAGTGYLYAQAGPAPLFGTAALLGLMSVVVVLRVGRQPVAPAIPSALASAGD